MGGLDGIPLPGHYLGGVFALNGGCGSACTHRSVRLQDEGDEAEGGDGEDDVGVGEGHGVVSWKVWQGQSVGHPVVGRCQGGVRSKERHRWGGS